MATFLNLLYRLLETFLKICKYVHGLLACHSWMELKAELMSGENLALYKNTSTNNVLGNHQLFREYGATDGNYALNRYDGHCFISGDCDRVKFFKDEKNVKIFPDYYMRQFLTGGSNNKTTSRGSYYLCNQYESYLYKWELAILKCNANIPPLRYVIVQQRWDVDTLMNICELEVFEAKDNSSKLWNQLPNHRLMQLTPYLFNRSSVHTCLINCMQLNCDAVNYNNFTSTCEIFQHPFGYYKVNIPNKVEDWDYWQLFYA
ncbi:hypothetical protein HELRODRAFT_183197 [Helobdella robusta]|uniref:Apple domain-containing protein n=1 Tax=Helobdella robusta TaxID=6412 RepID=T1FJA4_HELRO|nr:hypothetical protein HELRODRAFT_183197 [Helobdella robusta]ESO11411.1 hypothetical protein HELRODRAFT_183197 [Helobdella robusta]